MGLWRWMQLREVGARAAARPHAAVAPDRCNCRHMKRARAPLVRGLLRFHQHPNNGPITPSRGGDFDQFDLEGEILAGERVIGVEFNVRFVHFDDAHGDGLAVLLLHL